MQRKLNAAYQEHEIHKKMVEITGEQAEESDWSDWTLDFRNVGNNVTIQVQVPPVYERYWVI